MQPYGLEFVRIELFALRAAVVLHGIVSIREG